MPTTFSDIVPVRRVAVGDCSGPLGSGFDALARSAYASLLRADWTQSADPPFLPVHDNGQTANKSIPRGDAWKCSYGYDAAARTERSACGAVCYTFALPGDAYSPSASAYSESTDYTPGDRAKHAGVVYVCIAATSGEWDSTKWEEVEVADISTVSFSLTGDRYLDAGVDLYLVPSASPTPPAIADLLALTPSGTYCATSDQSPTPPNERHGVTEAVEATLGVAAQPYLHVALLLHDYLTNRGAWIEGGAMLDGAAATIGFSRDIEIAPAPALLPFLGPVYPSREFNINTGEPFRIPAPPLSWVFNYNTEETDVGKFLMPFRTLCSGAAGATARQIGGGSFPIFVTGEDITGFSISSAVPIGNGVACGVELREKVVSQSEVWRYMYSYGTVTIYDATSLGNGGTIELANTRSGSAGNLVVLVSAYEFDDVTQMPEFDNRDLFYGTGPHGLGAVEFYAGATGRLTVSRPPKTGFVGIVCTPRGGSGIFAAPSILDLA